MADIKKVVERVDELEKKLEIEKQESEEYTAEELLEMWQSILDSDGLPKIKDTHRRRTTAVLLGPTFHDDKPHSMDEIMAIRKEWGCED